MYVNHHTLCMWHQKWHPGSCVPNGWARSRVCCLESRLGLSCLLEARSMLSTPVPQAWSLCFSSLLYMASHTSVGTPPRKNCTSSCLLQLLMLLTHGYKSSTVCVCLSPEAQQRPTLSQGLDSSSLPTTHSHPRGVCLTSLSTHVLINPGPLQARFLSLPFPSLSTDC